ncbi:radical SAM protein [Actinosynnema sp. NPDC020468]|uniref:radical SAM protein n=1 Tax=Actinosynnema sp. NPDC020468 TaxID=3154488 RepID=UPI0033F8ABEA
MEAGRPITHLALELTGRCQLTCSHCYAESSPRGDHGVMNTADWLCVLDSAAKYGVRTVQFIGGEPTLHPGCIDLVSHALSLDIGVEVFTNLTWVNEDLWALYRHPGTTVATSYYTDDAEVHDSFTGVRGSHHRTRSNIAEAVQRGVRIRARVIDIGDGGTAARSELGLLGVTDVRVGKIQGIGRAAHQGPPTVADLCGGCGIGQAAVDHRGDVTPCVMAKWLRVGNILRDPLETILDGPCMRARISTMATEFKLQSHTGGDCGPKAGDEDDKNG